MTPFRLLPVIAAAALAAGCARSGTISHVDAYPYYYPSLVNYMGASGRVPTAIYGEPFPGGKAASDAAVTEALSLPGFFVQAPFEVTPNALAGAGPRIVLIFDPLVAPGGAACADPDEVARAPDPTELSVAAAFCYGAEPVSQAFFRGARPDSATDPAFRQGMSQLLLALLPSQDPQRGDQAEFPD